MAGFVTVLTGPSGVGKDAICTEILNRFRRFNALKTVSSTTRQPRPGEEDGVHYHFISRSTFEEQVAQGEFLEYAAYGGNLYGTNHRMFEEMLGRSQLVIAVLEINGCRQLKKKGIDPLICPILPDRIEVLEERIRARPNTSELDVANRLKEAVREIQAITTGEFGLPIVNRRNRLEETVSRVHWRIEARIG